MSWVQFGPERRGSEEADLVIAEWENAIICRSPFTLFAVQVSGGETRGLQGYIKPDIYKGDGDIKIPVTYGSDKFPQLKAMAQHNRAVLGGGEVLSPMVVEALDISMGKWSEGIGLTRWLALNSTTYRNRNLYRDELIISRYRIGSRLLNLGDDGDLINSAITLAELAKEQFGLTIRPIPASTFNQPSPDL